MSKRIVLGQFNYMRGEEMANIIKGNHDGPNGGNDSYNIPSRGDVRRTKLVREVKSGNHPKFGIYTRNNKEYVRANPDRRTDNNVNEDK